MMQPAVIVYWETICIKWIFKNSVMVISLFPLAENTDITQLYCILLSGSKKERESPKAKTEIS